VLSKNSPNKQQFHELLDQIRGEVSSLKDEIKELKKENSELRTKLKKIQDGQTDIYSAISESERLSLRHQVLGLISKIDDHLEDEE
jgi:cell division septum initiation protein DivIVA